MGIRVGICGAGSYASSFIPFFKAHPLVDEVCIAEVFPDRRREQAQRFGIGRAFASLDELCESDVDAIAICTQRWMHGPQAVQALRAGKHVYSAVPAGITLDEIGTLVETVKQTGLTYMLGETSYYYPCTLYCRERFARGDFGRFVYGEGEYLHDMSHGFYRAYQRSGDQWKSHASFPPMLYPSHSVSMIVSVTGAHLTRVSCFGQIDQSDDGVFLADVSLWGNTFSNETALFRTSDGGMCRINEFRRLGHPGAVRLSLYGTEGSYEEQANAMVWATRNKQEPMVDLKDLLDCKGVRVKVVDGKVVRDDEGGHVSGLSTLHAVERLPQEFLRIPTGHQGSHQFLVLDFVEACVSGKLPPNNVWIAARYCLPGIVAHESARRDGESLAIPDLGDPPA
ncbi:MAG: Gfo/Idh/MocA family oxidoreductase [Chloroflexi bacterium]|nr:Gfo/Idh/MocA family oxidoreductase [Chloroflexota bacterium]